MCSFRNSPEACRRAPAWALGGIVVLALAGTARASDDPPVAAAPAVPPVTAPPANAAPAPSAPPATPAPAPAARPDVLTLQTDLRVGVAYQDQMRRGLPAEGVVRVFEELEKSNPENAILHFLAGRARGKKSDLKEMRAALEKRLGLPPSERAQVAVGWFALGRAEAEQGMLDEALQSAGYALRLEPSEPAYALLGWIQRRRGNALQAITAYRAGLTIEPRAIDSRIALTDLLLRAGRVDEALPVARGTLVIAPRSALGQLYWGTALALAGSADDAKKAYQRALRLAGDDPDTVTTIAEALRRMDGQALAYTALVKAAATHPEHRGVLLQLVSAEIETGRASSAGARLDVALKATPADATLWYLRGLAHDGQSQPRDAAQAYSKAARIEGDRVEYRLAWGTALAKSGENRQALIIHRGTVQRFPDDARGHDFYGRALLDAGEFTEAAEEFEAVARLRPQDPDPCYLVAVVRGSKLSQMTEARTWLERYVQLGGSEAAALHWLEDLKKALGK